MYWWVVSHLHDDYDAKGKVTKSAAQKRKEFDDMLEPRPRTPGGGYRPSWWKGDEDAARSNLAMARAMGLPVPVDMARV